MEGVGVQQRVWTNHRPNGERRLQQPRASRCKKQLQLLLLLLLLPVWLERWLIVTMGRTAAATPHQWQLQPVVVVQVEHSGSSLFRLEVCTLRGARLQWK